MNSDKRNLHNIWHDRYRADIPFLLSTVRALRAEPTEAQVEAAERAALENFNVTLEDWNEGSYNRPLLVAVRAALNAAHVASAAAESEAAALRAERDGLRDKADQWDAAQPMIAAMTLVVEAAQEVRRGHPHANTAVDLALYAALDTLAALHDEGGET